MKHLFGGRAGPYLSGFAISVYAICATMPAPASAATTTTWSVCSNEGGVCSFSGTKQVRYGANGTYATKTATSAIQCSNAVFGDPVPYVAKKCEAATTVTTADPAPVTNPSASPGAGVFVDGASGNDNNPGTFAQPWKSLSKLAGAKVAAGAGVWLKCGSTYRGTLNLAQAQLQDGSIVGGYGSCTTTSKAVISGADDFSGGWTKSGNIWSRRVGTGTPKITQLFVGSVPQRVAQWPNYGGLGKEYAIADASSPSSSTVIKGNSAAVSALAGKDIVGATLAVREQPWLITQRTVSAYNASTAQFTLQSGVSYGMNAGEGYVLQNKLWMLDAPGEFFHDQVNGVLYVYPSTSEAQAALNSYGVEGTVRSLGLQVNNRSKLTIKNIAAVKTSNVGMLLSDAPGATVDSTIVSDNATAGVRIVYNASGTSIRNSTLARNGNTAIDAAAVSGVTIANNEITDTGMAAYVAGSSRTVSAGAGGIISGNVIRRSAYTAIGFSGTGGSQITNNVVEDSCLRLSDGGAIYTWNGTKATTNQSSLVSGNVVARAPANIEGSVGGANSICVGIYADDDSRSVTIRGNTVVDVPVGIKLHNTSNSTVESNKVWLSERVAMWTNMDRTSADASTNNVIRSNQFNTVLKFSGSYPSVPYFNPDYTPIWFWHAMSGINAIKSGSNSYSGNELLMLNGDAMTAAAIRSSSGGIINMSSSEWRKMNTGEAAARLTSQFAGYTATLGSELISNGEFLSGLSGWTSWFASAATKGSVTAAAATGCTATCALFAAGTIYDALTTPAFSMSSGGLYRLKFNAHFQTDGSLGFPGVSNGTGMSNFINLSDTAGSTIAYEGFYKATSSASGKVNLSAAAGTRVGFDGVSVKQITGYTLAAPKAWAAYAYGSPTASKTVDCSTLGWSAGCSVTDGNGTAVSLPTTLAAGQAKLFLLKGTALRVK